MVTRTELEILLRRYLTEAQPGDYVIVDCGPSFVQSVVQDGSMLVEARGQLEPELLRKVDELFADYRLGGQGTSEAEAGCLTLAFAPGDAGVAEAMTRALDLIAFNTSQPLSLSDGQGAFMPKRKGFLGLGAYGPII
jgi:hypothetical protein